MGEIARVMQREPGPAALVTRYAGDFGSVLPRHVAQDLFVQTAIGLLDNPELARTAQLNPQSLLRALRECARLGHMPGTEECAIVPFRDKHAPGGWNIVLIEQYQGEIERMYRAGQVRAVKCEVIRENDDFLWHPLEMRLPVHRFDPLEDEETRGPLRGVYAYAELADGGTSQVVVMPKSEVMRHKALAKTMVFWEGPFESSMWRKTAVHELAKWVATSSEWLTGITLPAAPAPAAAVAALPPAAAKPDRRDYASSQQLKELNDLMNVLGVDEDKDQRLAFCEKLAGRELTGELYDGHTSGNLLRDEAGELLDRLRHCNGDPAQLTQLLTEAAG